MKTTRIGAVVAVVVLALVLAPAAASADDKRVGLGASIGAVFPDNGDPETGRDIDWDDVGLNWGFWVDIPIAWVFHITPSAEIYDLGGEVSKGTATDICLNFKFIIPISFMRLFLGLAGGVSVAYDEYNPNAGALVGMSFRLISNLEAFIQGKYKILIDEPNIHAIHANAGLLILF